MPLNVYLNFNGNCREVFDFYRSVFGGEFSMHLTFHELPEDMGMSGEELNQILHVSYDIGGTTLMGSDVPSAFGPPVTIGNNMSISYLTETREQTEEYFNKISEGGTVTMPLDDQFWGDYFGACTDKFGINWMFNCASEPPSS